MCAAAHVPAQDPRPVETFAAAGVGALVLLLRSRVRALRAVVSSQDDLESSSGGTAHLFAAELVPVEVARPVEAFAAAGVGALVLLLRSRVRALRAVVAVRLIQI